MTAVASLCFVAITLATPHARADDDDVSSEPAREAPAPRRGFGAAGTIVLDDILGFGFGSAGSFGGISALGAPGAPTMTGWIRYEDAKLESGGRSTRVTALAIAPTVDAFVASNLSVGAQVALSSSRLRATDATTALGARLRPRIGYVIRITEDLAFWPRAFGSFGVTHASYGARDSSSIGMLSGNAKQSYTAWGFGAEAVFVARVGRHVALTFGPSLAYGKTDASDGPDPLAISSATVSAGVRGGLALVF